MDKKKSGKPLPAAEEEEKGDMKIEEKRGEAEGGEITIISEEKKGKLKTYEIQKTGPLKKRGRLKVSS